MTQSLDSFYDDQDFGQKNLHSFSYERIMLKLYIHVISKCYRSIGKVKKIMST